MPRSSPRLRTYTIFGPIFGEQVIGTTVPRVGVQLDEGTIPPDKLEWIARETRVMDAGGNVVETDARIESEDHGHGQRAYVALVPVNPLPDGWYELQLSGVPPGFVLPDFSWHHDFPGGSLGSRFRSGPGPVLTSVRVCRGHVYLDVSEPIADIAAARAHATVATCTLAPRAGGDQVAEGELRFDCPVVPSTIAVSISSGLAAVSGVDVVPVERSIKEADLIPWGAGCDIYRF